ncbi:MAG: biosynthetic-type acetolactate synthase large subunit [Muribaculaceae bacterium]|nr:biosynthetic-type acetolactate synthase large subunit [Muribaculaceae bacterium]
MGELITGAEALMKCLVAESVDRVFGYPGGSIMPVYDKLYNYENEILHVLTRHEQGAVHAAQGYARATGKTGVVIATSGPGAMNLVTGIADAKIDSTPLVIITGQVGTGVLGTDAFQETDMIDVANPISKWGIQLRSAEEIPDVISRAFFIANSGRPGPVVIDFPKNVQTEIMEWTDYKTCSYIRTYNHRPEINEYSISKAAALINSAERPLILAGHGVTIAGAERLLGELAEKADIPVAVTLLGLSVMPSKHPLFKGMLGMHGNIAPNIATNRADVIIAIGMRFDDRVVCRVKDYAPNAQIVHIDIDASEIGRIVPTQLPINADAKDALEALLPLVNNANHKEWLDLFSKLEKIEDQKVHSRQLNRRSSESMGMGEVVDAVAGAVNDDAILVTDVGQNQMFAAKYFRFSSPRSMISSGGLGTMGFGIPAAIGAKMGCPDRIVCLFTGDGGFQMTVQELGTIMEYNVKVKIIILNNNFLGNVRQWQELFFNSRFSQTKLLNPDFIKLAEAYGIKGEDVGTREELQAAVQRMIRHDGSYILNVNIDEKDMIFPMIPLEAAVDEILLDKEERLDVLHL